eukprot:gene28933-biopygen24794
MDTALRWVAVVDDEAPLRRGLLRLPRVAEVPARSYDGGAALLAELAGAAATMAPFYVVLDLHMPGMSGYVRVHTTSEPRAVLVMHSAQHHDLILLDLNMLLMNRFEVLENLKEAARGEYLPVLAITAAFGDKQRALDAGVTDFGCKPFDHVELLARIRNILELRLLFGQVLAMKVRRREHPERYGVDNAVFSHVIKRVADPVPSGNGQCGIDFDGDLHIFAQVAISCGGGGSRPSELALSKRHPAVVRRLQTAVQRAWRTATIRLYARMAMAGKRVATRADTALARVVSDRRWAGAEPAALRQSVRHALAGRGASGVTHARSWNGIGKADFQGAHKANALIGCPFDRKGK